LTGPSAPLGGCAYLIPPRDASARVSHRAFPPPARVAGVGLACGLGTL